jgi:uncharacterized oxidoreductase
MDDATDRRKMDGGWTTVRLTGNTVLVTGGGSGIGRGLAEAFHRMGNTVIISGRRRAMLDAATVANPGMHAVELDVADPASIAKVVAELTAQFPDLNVLINNAGIMRIDDASTVIDEEALVSTVTTNLLGPIRMTSALIEHFKGLEQATVINVTSGLAFTPLAMTAVYSATKAALHSYTLSLRYKLKGSPVSVLELAPPYVQTDLMGGADDPRAMKLDAFLAETMVLLAQESEEILVERVKPLRNNAGPNEAQFVNQFNDGMSQPGH